MRLAVLSDIHANLVASMRSSPRSGASTRSGSSATRSAMDRDRRGRRAARSIGAIAVAGNHDRAAVGDEIEWFNADARRRSSGQREMPTRREPGSPTSGAARGGRLHPRPRQSRPTWEYILDPARPSPTWRRSRPSTLCSAIHTHLPIAYRHVPPRMREIVPDDGDQLELGDARTCSTRAASASRATATRPRAGSSSTPIVGATWHRTRTTSRRRRPRCASPACRPPHRPPRSWGLRRPCRRSTPARSSSNPEPSNTVLTAARR